MTISPLPALRLRPSRHLTAILLLIGLGGVISIWFLQLYWLAKLLISLGVGLLTCDAIRHHALLLRPNAWLGLRLNQQQQIVLFNQSTEQVIRLHADSVVTVNFIMLRYDLMHSANIRAWRRWHYLIIMSDACDADALRQWRVWLWWGLAQQQIAQDD